MLLIKGLAALSAFCSSGQGFIVAVYYDQNYVVGDGKGHRGW
jgi:hypothetical protein